MNYFSTCETVEDVKKLYRKLAMQWHPDRNEDKKTATAKMQEINNEYHRVLSSMNGQKSTTGKNTYTYKYDQEQEQAIMDKINEALEVLGDALSDGVELWLIGSWVWIVGNTKPYKDLLGRKGLEFTFHSKRKTWYWKPYEQKSRYRKSANLSDIADKYGAKRFAQQERRREQNARPRLAAAG